MARINIDTIRREDKNLQVHKFNEASYTLFKSGDDILFQIDTYSGADKHQTQSIQFDIENLPKFLRLVSSQFQSFTIPLLDDDGEVKYGINWGNRDNRKNKNEAYLDLPKEIYNSDFFPINGIPFELRTDDGQNLRFSRAQPKVKGSNAGHVIQTERNATIGEYLRNRLNVSLGAPITKEDIQKYGRSYITITKCGVNTETSQAFYFFDFSTKKDVKQEKINIKVSASHFSEYENYLSAIKTKPFLILGGFSGTGKSLKVKELAFETCPCDGILDASETSPGNYQLIPVKPNWHDASELTGFYSSVNRNYYVTDFMRFLVKAKHYESQKIPFFVCLDEMNLAPVEEYFADFLSIIESRKRLDDGRIVSDPLVPASVFNNDNYADDFNIFMSLGLKTINDMRVDEINAHIKNGEEDIFERQDIVDDLMENGLTLPQNVVVIGTVNMDDTTNTFSRKVIDRAMTFETVIEEFNETDYFERQPNLSYVENPISGELILPDEVSANRMIDEDRFLISEDDKKKVIGFINNINSDLEGTPFKISYRVINETILLYRAKQIVNNAGPDANTVNIEDVFDDILMQKVLPRIEGDYDKCDACLVKLAARAGENNWGKSSVKIEFMIGRFGKDQTGFTSFWN
ncbi:MAG: NgoFVII family restriction endonuclease [Paludibacteraceae bacterium]|nr:NgoFVII family restriction endonuclease [Paludibacteraceae bacterium]